MWQITYKSASSSCSSSNFRARHDRCCVTRETIRVAKGPEENWAALAALRSHRSQSLVESRDLTVLPNDTRRGVVRVHRRSISVVSREECGVVLLGG